VGRGQMYVYKHFSMEGSMAFSKRIKKLKITDLDIRKSSRIFSRREEEGPISER
jgi:hypothetical protein